MLRNHAVVLALAFGLVAGAALALGGLALARRMALLNYRSPTELNTRFQRSWQSGVSPLGLGGRFAVESYLDFHGNKFTRRFDANTYIRLVEAMDSHDIGRDRGGVQEALRRITATALVRPSRSVHEVDARSVRRKMKDKAFARGVSRDDVVAGAAALGIDLDEHIEFVVTAMRGSAASLGLAGTTAVG